MEMRSVEALVARRYFKKFLTEKLYDFIKNGLHITTKSPKVFISYAWAKESSSTYQQDKIYEIYVEKIAKDLKRIGCEVFLDRWFDKKG